MTKFGEIYIKKASLKLSDIISQTRDYLITKYKQGSQVFSPASPFGMILVVLENLNQLLLWYLEDAVVESNIQTATRVGSIRGLAALTGHNASRPYSAYGNVLLKNITAKNLVVVDGSRIKLQGNNLTYSLDLGYDYKKIDSNEVVEVTIIQGEWRKNSFLSNGTATQSFVINENPNEKISENYVKLSVNSEYYERMSNFYEMLPGQKSFVVKNGIGGGIAIILGNGDMGNIPSVGSTITVEYLITNGILGNIPEDTTGKVLLGNWLDGGLDTNGNYITLNDSIETRIAFPIIMGTDGEDTYTTRNLASKRSSTEILATPKSFEYFLGKRGGLDNIKAFSNGENNPYGNYIYLNASPSLQVRKSIFGNYFNIPYSGFLLTNEEKSKILTEIKTSNLLLIGTEIEFIDSSLEFFTVNIRINAGNYDKTQIKNRVLDIVQDFIESCYSKNFVSRSELIALLENGIEEIISCDVYFIAKRDEDNIRLGINGNKNLTNYGDIQISNKQTIIFRGGWQDRINKQIQDIPTNKNGELGAINVIFS